MSYMKYRKNGQNGVILTDQNHSSDISSEQEVIRYTKKLAQIFGLNEKNAEVYTALSGKNRH